MKLLHAGRVREHHEQAGKGPALRLTATDGSGRHLIQYALPGCDFETAESLETDGLIKKPTA
jgi:hypothetical protein